MSEDKDYEKYIKALSYVMRSNNRTDVTLIIGKSTLIIPSNIAKQMNLRVNQISATLSDLKEHDVVICINEEERVGRLYKLTDIGSDIYEFLKNNQ